jgi:hypothetical protein
MTNLDAFWAAKIVMSFTDRQIRAAVEMGGLTDKAAEDYLARTIIERRDKIGRHWFAQVNPLDRFSITGPAGDRKLEFEDFELSAGLANAGETSYQCQLVYYGCEGGKELIHEQTIAAGDTAAGLALDAEFTAAAAAHLEAIQPATDCARRFHLTVRVGRGQEAGVWGKFVRVYMDFVGGDEGFKLIGVEREE